MATVVENPVSLQEDLPAVKGDDYPDGEEYDVDEEEGEEGEGEEGSTPPVAAKSGFEEDLYAELTIEELKEVFRLFDYEKLGYITLETFGGILHELDDDWTDEDVAGILADIDTDGNGAIDFEEFVKIMT